VNAATATDTFYYGGTVIVGGEPYAAAPTAAGWVNRKMWTWNSAGYNLVPHSGLNMDGWKGMDNTAQTENYFYVADNATMGQACVIAGTKSLFCGATNAQCVDLCYVEQIGTGYGNNWSQTVVTKSYTFNAGDQIQLDYDYNNESEPGYDFTDVILQYFDGADWVDYDTMAEYTDLVNGSEIIDVDSYMAALTPPVTFRIRFTFMADGGYSDEDGNFPTTCGGLEIDNYVLDINGTPDSENFEGVAVGGLPVGWLKVVGGCGDFARVKALADLPMGLNQDPCVAILGTQWCSIADSVLVFIDEDNPSYYHPLCQDNYAKSPLIDFSAHPGLPGRTLQGERFASLPMGDLIFMYWQARYKPGCASGGFSPWVSDNYVYYTAEGTSCRPLSFDLSTFIPPGADQVQVAWGVINYCDEDPWGDGCSYVCNATPYYDNTTFGVFGSPVAPLISMRELDFWQDQFAEDGTLNPTSTADTRTPNYQSNLLPPIFGDTLNCRIAGTDVEAYYVFRIDDRSPQQPYTDPFFTTWFPAAQTGAWCEARMDTTRVTNSAGTGTITVGGRYMATFHEADPIRIANGLAEGTEILPNNLFVPGTAVEYFIKAKYTGSAFEYLLPDTVEKIYYNTDPWWRMEWDDSGVWSIFEWYVLPQYVSDGVGGLKWPCLIMADHFGGRGTWIWYNEMLEVLLDSQGYEMEVYRRYGPSSDLRNGIGRRSPNPGQIGGPGTPKWAASPGATIGQFLAYKFCILNAGNIYSYSMYQSDVALISDWLNLYTSSSGISRGFWLSGDQVVRELNRRVPWGSSFLNSTLCATFVDLNYAAYENNYTFCLPIDYVAGGRVACGTPAKEWVIRQNGCPRTYSVIGVAAAAGCNAVAEREYDVAVGPAVTSYAAVSNIKSVPGGANFRTFTEGYDFWVMRANDSMGFPACDTSLTLVTSTTISLKPWVDCVLGWLGWNINELCTPTLVGVNPNIPSAPAVVSSLAQAYPNPMNPTATISYTVGAPGKVSLKVFDVTGRVIKTLVDESQPTGAYAVIWDGTNDRGEKVASGVFFYQLNAPGFSGAKKIVILQ